MSANTAEKSADFIGIDILAKTEPKPTYVQDDHDKDVCRHVYDRFTDMRSKRSIIDRNWKLYQQQYESLFIPYSDGRSRSNVPIELAQIEGYASECIKRKSTVTVRENDAKYQYNAQIFEKVWDYDMSVNHRYDELWENETITATFGTSVMYTGHEIKTNVIHDFDGCDSDGNITFTKKMQTIQNIIFRNIDIRYFFIDDRAHSTDDAEDCIYFEYIPRNMFESFKYQWGYKNLDKVTATYNYGADMRYFLTLEDRAESSTGFVELCHYWNVASDDYFCIANRQCVIREHPLISKIDSRKALPFAVRPFSKNPYSIYGRGICEVLQPIKSDINNLREMLMDAVKRSNSTMIAMGGNLKFNGTVPAYNNQIAQFLGDLSPKNFQQLTGTPPNQSGFTYLDSLYKDAAMYGYYDVRNILGNPQQTAYQTAVQKESSLARINVVFANRDKAFQRLFNLHKSNIINFFPVQMVRDLVEIDGEWNPIGNAKKTYPQIPLDGVKKEWKGSKSSIVKSFGAMLHEITPDDLSGDYAIEVLTDLNAPTIHEHEKEQLLAFSQGLGVVSENYANDPSLDAILPKDKFIKMLADKFGIDTQSSQQQQVEQKKQEVIAKYKQMAQDMRSQTQQSPMQALQGAPQGQQGQQQQWQSQPQAPAVQQMPQGVQPTPNPQQ